MSSHRATRRPRLGPTRRWTATALAVLVGVAVTTGGLGTYAYWNDQAAVSTGTVRAGVLDLQVDGSNAAGLGTGYAKPAIAFADRSPGEVEAYPLALHNAGNAPGTYTLTVARGSAWTYSDSAVVVQAFTGSVVEDTTYPLIDTCTGTSLGPPQLLASATPRTLVTTARTLAPGASETLCLRIGLDAAAGNVDQGKAGTLVLGATLTQVTS